MLCPLVVPLECGAHGRFRIIGRTGIILGAYADYSPKSPPARATGLFGCSSQGWHPGLLYVARLRGLDVGNWRALALSTGLGQEVCSVAHSGLGIRVGWRLTPGLRHGAKFLRPLRGLLLVRDYARKRPHAWGEGVRVGGLCNCSPRIHPPGVLPAPRRPPPHTQSTHPPGAPDGR